MIDGLNAIYRAFFALRHGLRAPDGTPTNAVFGFATMLNKVMREESPTWIVVAFDSRGGGFRKRIFADYKANRDAQPEDLSRQIPLVRELLAGFRIPILEVEDFEADDVIATLVRGVADDVSVSIISTDKDLMQLVNDHVELVDSGKMKRYGPAEVEERFGVPPEKILDLRSLIGDPSDNIPGVKGIGEKGAAKLIGEWETLEALLDHAEEVKAKRAREALIAHREDAELSKRLSILRMDVPLALSLEEMALRDPDKGRLGELYRRLNFAALESALRGDGVGHGEGEGETNAAAESGESRGFTTDISLLTQGLEVEKFLEELDSGPVALHLLAGEGSAVRARFVGLAIAGRGESAAYIPLLGEGLVAEAGLAPAELIAILSRLWPLEGTASRDWYAFSTKEVQSVFAEAGLSLPPPVADLEIAHSLIDPGGSHGSSALALSILERRLDSWEDVAGRGAKAIAAEEIPVDRAADFAGAQVAACREMKEYISEEIASDSARKLYREIELPLTGVLSRMERDGLRIDEEKLACLGSEYGQKLASIREEIYASAGEEFLITSPKQLQVILFDKLKLPVIKKTKTGYSTAESVLEQLRTQHELPGLVLGYRKLAKLMSTYIEALPPLVDENTGRIHPHFNQLGAATGRLSASHPNVQNIPIRGEEGARIREAFVPAEDHLLISADYSQVELRILAHYSADPGLIDAFRRGDDVHLSTAAQIWDIPEEAVSSEQRVRAKAVNFGIIYGSSAFGLANQLGIATGEAQATIDAYFERYSGVRRFIDETISRAADVGFVSTLLGRRRSLPDLKSRNRVLRQAAERMAINTVIQGTAADLIKRAMVEVDRALFDNEFQAKMILQVHDELVFEVRESELSTLTDLLRDRMESALTLEVPLIVDFGVGASWREAH